MQAFYRRPMAFAAVVAVLMALVAYRLNATAKLICLALVASFTVIVLVLALLRRGGKRMIEALLCLLAVSIALTSSADASYGFKTSSKIMPTLIPNSLSISDAVSASPTILPCVILTACGSDSLPKLHLAPRLLPIPL